MTHVTRMVKVGNQPTMPLGSKVAPLQGSLIAPIDLQWEKKNLLQNHKAQSYHDPGVKNGPIPGVTSSHRLTMGKHGSSSL